MALAYDLPGVQAVVPRLFAVTTWNDDLGGYYSALAEETPQWLSGVHCTARLWVAAQVYSSPRDRFVRGLLAGMWLRLLPDVGDDGRDVDT